MTTPATAPAGRFVFKGTDGVEAEDFIFAVRQKALTEGKIQDNQWLVDYALGCFARSALRWHITLDTSVQSDWKKLEMALMSRYRPMFRGIDGIECEDFLADVRGRILDEGKEDDRKWIINTVAASFVGDALRWYLKLDPEIKTDWDLLQIAMMAKFPPPDEREWTPSYAIPLPAAAPDPLVQHKGRIRVDADVASNSGYISRILQSSGYYAQVTSKKAEALVVQFKATSEPFAMEATNFTSSNWKYLGLVWSTASFSLDASSSQSYAGIVGIENSSGGVMKSSWTSGGAVADAVWELRPDKSLIPTWDNIGTKHDLTPFFTLGTRPLFASVIGSVTYQTGSSYNTARLYFEPM